MSAAIPASIKWGVIGLGRCGGNLAEEFYLRGYPAIALNSSFTDLRAGRLPAENRFYVGLQKHDGAGQDMNLGERYLRANAKKVLETVVRKLDGAENLLLTAGLAGGTGSSLSVLAEIVSEYGTPLSAMVALPVQVEGSIAKVNAIQALNKLIASPVTSFILIDNQKIFSRSAGTALSELYPVYNRQIVTHFDTINRLSHNPAYRPILGFDAEDLRKFFLTKGSMLFGEISLNLFDFQNEESLLLRLKEIWQDFGILASGNDYSQTSMLSIIILAGNALMKGASVHRFERFLSLLKETAGSCGIYLGLFMTPEREPARLYAIVAGLPLPQSLEALLAQARAEGKLLSLKAETNLAEIPLDDFKGINLFLKSKSTLPTRPPESEPLLKGYTPEDFKEEDYLKPWRSKNLGSA